MNIDEQHFCMFCTGYIAAESLLSYLSMHISGIINRIVGVIVYAFMCKAFADLHVWGLSRWVIFFFHRDHS